MPDVIIHRQGVAGRITLNRPQALHALNEEMCLAMDAALKAWADLIPCIFTPTIAAKI